MVLPRILLWLLLVSTCFGVYAADGPAGPDLVQKFKACDNSVERQQMLYSLEPQVYAGSKSAAVPTWVRDLLMSALADKSPVVVDAAVYRIGTFSLSDANTKLINLYNSVERTYSRAYAKRIRYTIITTLGKTGGPGASLFLARLLSEDQGNDDRGEFILQAIADLADPALADRVGDYRARMEAQVQAARKENMDPLLYSHKLMCLTFASDLEQTLRAKGGK
ncbi:MAG: hypothetical protein JW768_08200 [Chitinispirillaceae bacterium]|nr:hypothetical protein [Chitinispirillaceae bacterium]